MKDDSHNDVIAPLVIEDAEVRRLVRCTLSDLAVQAPGRTDGMTRRLERLVNAFVSPDEELRHEMLLQLREYGVPIHSIVDEIIPAVARRMGVLWATDHMTFAHVTLGAGRLQDAVRALGWHDRHRRHPPEDAPVILLIIPRCEHHTLGAFVLADQWRRMGFRVDVAIDKHPRQIADMLHNRNYVMIGITAAGRRTLASARELVDIIRLTQSRVAPIFIGGAILDREIDVLAITGADHVARDARSALRQCGLSTAGRDTPSLVTTGHAGAQDNRR
jgi:methanogenic corrinoid protein MtbC1